MAEPTYGYENGKPVDASVADTFDYNKAIGISPNNDASYPALSNTQIQKSIDPNAGGIGDILSGMFTDKSGNLNLGAIGGIGGGILGALGALNPDRKRSGYQGSIPKYEAVRNMVTAPPTREQGYRPGQGGINYGGDVTYTPKASTSTGSSGGGGSSTLGNIAKVAGGAGLAALLGNYLSNPNNTGNIASILKGITSGSGSGQPTPGQLERDDAAAVDAQYPANNIPDWDNVATENPSWDILPPAMPTYTEFPSDFDYTDWSFAKGGSTGRYLQGETDGMADKIPAQIGEDQPAALSHGEFVIPADVVSHLGNGNSDAGAKKLYSMMDKIREARTGTKQQGKRINPDKFMPGGLAQAYAGGGEIKKFAGESGSAVSGLGTAANAGVTGSETGPNTWAGEYMSDMLGKGQALANAPYQQYGGPLTAGESGLQSKVFGGLQNTNFPGNLGQSFSSAGAYQAPQLNMGAYQQTPIGTGPTSGGPDATQPATLGSSPAPMGGVQQPQQPQGIASQYMNPYLESVLNPQMEELRRQAKINSMSGIGALTKSGAFGGGRQAIMESEANRNLLQEQNKAIGQGYASAFDRAQQQFNAEQNQGMGLARLMSEQGAQQRGIEAEGIAADKAAFEAARENPYKMLQFQQSLLSGMPVSATSIDVATPSKTAEVLSGIGGGIKYANTLPSVSTKSVTDLLGNLGLSNGG